MRYWRVGLVLLPHPCAKGGGDRLKGGHFAGEDCSSGRMVGNSDSAARRIQTPQRAHPALAAGARRSERAARASKRIGACFDAEPTDVEPGSRWPAVF